MTQKLTDLLAKNREWAERIKHTEPEFFAKLTAQQKPKYLWIGCADSRVPCTQLVDLLPGDMFVHRNVANLVIHTDFNCLSVMQYAIEVLKVEHIIVCGHYRCGGIQAAMQHQEFGLIDNWLRHVQDIIHKYQSYINQQADEQGRLDALCELNVMEQVVNVCENTLVRNAWLKGQQLTVHGWIYGVEDGLLRDLDLSISSTTEMKAAVAHLQQKTT
ncbi:carbonate dehydratase [Agitococcus lubricus]|uniref:Carbonic anhydrase n=1 Tax=Agitococcus lubricus TaxID=1077255 RepID=A0A2T5J0X2_9GAMM|nr:carbonate dehydratase [Agitococcus lubricus]PTQ89984.1 carbonic anhydrase [Agitococcus lubricus]